MHHPSAVVAPLDGAFPATFEMTDGSLSNRICIPPATEDDEWREMNEASVQEYEAHHQGAYPESTTVIQNLFAGFVARHLRGAVLDVGFGMELKVPLYAKDIPNLCYFGIDPIDRQGDREYPFICTRVEDSLPALATRRFDGFIYATSLDLIRNPACTGRLTRALAAAGSRASFWIGLPDPRLVAGEIRATALEKIIATVTWRTSIYKALRWQMLSPRRLPLGLRKRQRSLRPGKPLHHLHFHHFTGGSARRILLDNFSAIVDDLLVPAANSRFYCTQLDATPVTSCAE